MNELQIFSKRQWQGEVLEIPNIEQQELFFCTLGINSGMNSRNALVRFIILRDGTMMAHFQLPIDVGETS